MHRLAAILLTPLILASCDKDDGECTGSLSDWCRGDCPTQAELEAERSGCPSTSCQFDAETCGAVQVLTCACDFDSTSYYFDDSGVLVAVLGYTDSPQYCSTDDTGSFWIWWGERPDGCAP